MTAVLRHTAAVSQPLTVLPRHTVTVSLVPLRDDGCQLLLSSQ
ncbi:MULTISPECIES: hypothetical protein [unclassified Wolbachia]